MLDVLIPALLLGEIFRGTANLLSFAPAEELSQHGPLPKYHPRQDTWCQDCHLLFSSGSQRQAVPLPRALFNSFLETKCDLKNCRAVILKLKFLPEFPVTNSKGDFLGISKDSQFLKNIWGFRKDNLCRKGYFRHLRQLGSSKTRFSQLLYSWQPTTESSKEQFRAEIRFSPSAPCSGGAWEDELHQTGHR